MRKLLILCFLSLCLQVPLRSFGQTISLEVQDTPLESVFRLVQQQSLYRFVYTSEDLAATKKVTLSVSNSSIQPLLEKIFKDQPLAYNLRGQVIIVSRTTKTESPALPDGIVVRGKVIDEAGNGLPAVSITLKGKPLTTATDEKGNFTFREIDPTAIVLVTSVGYESQQVNIAGRTALVIQLARQISTLEETVIKGYYATSRRLNTGAVAKITATDIGHQPADDFLHDMLELKKELGAIGNNFNQAVHKLHLLEKIPEFRNWIKEYGGLHETFLKQTEQINSKLNNLYEQWLLK